MFEYENSCLFLSVETEYFFYRVTICSCKVCALFNFIILRSNFDSLVLFAIVFTGYVWLWITQFKTCQKTLSNGYVQIEGKCGGANKEQRKFFISWVTMCFTSFIILISLCKQYCRVQNYHNFTSLCSSIHGVLLNNLHLK